MLSTDESLDIIRASVTKTHLVREHFQENFLSQNGFSLFLDMRKALSRDVEKKSLIPILHPVRPEDLVDD